jgi:hypothetical protein
MFRTGKPAPNTCRDRIISEIHSSRFRTVKPIIRHPAGQIVVNKHPRALRVTLELDNIPLASVGQHDASLRAAANRCDVCNCVNRHFADSVSFAQWFQLRLRTVSSEPRHKCPYPWHFVGGEIVIKLRGVDRGRRVPRGRRLPVAKSSCPISR